MLIAAIAGSDKTTVSVATGHQEYHPVYQSPGNLINMARKAHGKGIMPIAFLPIPKGTFISPFFELYCTHLQSFVARLKHRKTTAYKTFCRQMYHACLARVFEPLRAGMTTPDIIQCADGHWRKAIYCLGPYIADYPEQVWLSGIVQGWCPK